MLEFSVLIIILRMDLKMITRLRKHSYSEFADKKKRKKEKEARKEEEGERLNLESMYSVHL